jgi:hypothetical protein
MKRIYVIIVAVTLFASPSLLSCKNKDKTTTQEQKTDAPVVVNADDQLRTGVAAVTAAYPGVTADVKDGVITLRGNVKREDLQNIIMKVQELRPKKVENQLVIQ